MLATSGPVPHEPGWAFEFTWDGTRSLAEVEPGRVRLYSGDRGAVTTSYPELDVLPALAGRRLLLDGKIVALDGCGRPSLSRLQHRMNLERPSAAVLRRVPVVYYVFDLLRLDERSTLQLPYRQRRELLAELDLDGGPVVLTPYFLDTDGQAMLNTAAEYGLPGVVAKRADSTYQPGRRSRCWVQTSLRRTQEVVIGGWVPARRGPARALGALLVGVPTDAGLRYAGQVSVGLTDVARYELRNRLAGREQRRSPFLDEVPPEIARNAVWVVPDLFGEVSYRRWTTHGRLAHPSWTGLRHGRHPAAVQGPVVLAAPPRLAAPGAATEAPQQTEESELEDELRRARADVAAQRAQISPHFLYNALSAIAALVRTDPPRARELLMEFAGFTRYSLRSAVDFSTLADELENVDRYLALEQARLEERLRVTVQVDPRVYPVVLPFLALHSVVENAVRNGVEVIPGGGAVAISAVAHGDDCRITVTADGPDPPAESELGELDARLRSVFGENYGLVTDHGSGGASTVILRVPQARAAPEL